MPFAHAVAGLSPQRQTFLVYLSLLLVIAFGLMLRVWAFSQSEVPKYPHGDAARYFAYAYNLKNFGVYGSGDLSIYPADSDPDQVRRVVKPDALVTPGLPLFLSLFLGGEYTEGQRDAILLTQALLSTLTIVFVYLAFSIVGRAYGLFVAALTAANPHLVNLNLHFLTEPLFTFLLAGFVLVLSRTSPDRKAWWYVLVGMILGLASLTRPWIQGFLIVLLVWLIFGAMRIDWRKALLVFAGSALLVSPWLIRNKTTLGFVADPTLSGKSIFHGMYPDMMYNGMEESLGYAYNHDPMGPQMQGSIDATLSELGRRVKDDPATYAKWFLAGKTRSVLSWGYIAGADAVLVYPVGNSPYFRLPTFYLSSYYMQQAHGFLMILAILGTIAVWLPARMQPISGPPFIFLRSVSLLVFYFLVMHSIGAPYPRYSVPMRPILYGMSLYPLLLIGWPLVMANKRRKLGRE